MILRQTAVPLVVIALAVNARAQAVWQLTDDYDSTPRRPAPGKTPAQNPEAVFPLSGNIILGRTQWVDTQDNLGVLLMNKLPSRADDLLVARTDDCTPRAVLRQVRTATRGNALAVRVVNGELKPGMEIVLPTEKLLKECVAKLPARTDGAVPKTSPTATTPATKTPAAPATGTPATVPAKTVAPAAVSGK